MVMTLTRWRLKQEMLNKNISLRLGPTLKQKLYEKILSDIGGGVYRRLDLEHV